MIQHTVRPHLTLVLVRHAKTDYNSIGPEGRFCGTSDPPLNELGHRQAAAIADKLRCRRVAVVASSPLLRSIQTANTISKSFGLPVAIDDRLREIHYGKWEGLRKKEVQAGYPADWRAFEADPATSVPPEGENVEAVLGRMNDYVSSITQSAIIVGHKTAFRLFLCSLLGRSLSEYRSFSDLRIASISEITMGSTAQVIRLNETSHLDFVPKA